MTHAASFAPPRTTGDLPDFILDGRLAFSEHGLLLALALARSRRVWLVQGLWALLQRFEIADYPEFADEPGEAERMLPVLREWHRVWTGSTLLERFCWIGDVLFESHLPPGFDRHAQRRLQGFAVRLEQRARFDGPVSALTLCARDAVALAALNVVETPVILTLLPDAGRPQICDLLARAGVPSTALAGGAARALSWRALGPLPFVARILGAQRGLRLAALGLSCPGAVVAGLETEDEIDPDDGPCAAEDDPWRNATACWWEVTP